MARRLAQRLIPAFAAAMMICACLLGAKGARAAPDPALAELQARLTELSTLLNSDAAARLLPLPQLLMRTGLVGLTDELPVAGQGGAETVGFLSSVPAGPAAATVENFRIALALLTQMQGGQDNLDVLLAHPQEDTRALTFRSGTVTLDGIRQALRDTGMQSDMRAGFDLLRVPVILWEDTVLRLGPHDRLEMSRPDGAFLISFGRVEIDGAHLASHGGGNLTSKDFVPFVTVAGGGSLMMRGATMEGLGFGKTAKFSGLAVLGHPLMASTGPSVIADSHFEDLVTLNVAGVEDMRLTGNRFYNMRNSALVLSMAMGARVDGNLFFGDGPTNSIRVLRGSDGAQVDGNVLLDGDRAGILVQGQSNGVMVSGNVIWQRSGGAIKISGTRCGTVRHNVILNSRQKGIDLRSSDHTTVHANTISGSQSAGIWVSAQEPEAVTYVTGNILRGNEAGLATATAAHILLTGNDFSKQFPRLVDGDIVMQNRAIVADLTGRVPVVLSASGQGDPADLTAPDCGQGDMR